jgi:hypothetical protein
MKKPAPPVIEGAPYADESAVGLAAADIYISADVETDGPIPGPYSMLSFALVVAGTFDGRTFKRAGIDPPSFYRELRPISGAFQPEALAVNRLDRDRLLREGASPEAAMEQARIWVLDVSRNARPVLVAYPVAFDWTWLYWYFTRFCAGGSPFGFSSCFDIKTMIAVKRRSRLTEATKRDLPEDVRSQLRHTHEALDDAREQAELFANLFDWTPMT